MKKPIVVVGSVNMDLVATADRIPVPGETISGSSFRTFPGGKGANQAVAVARLGWPVHLIGRVGNDAFGQELRTALEFAGVKTDCVGVAEESSGVASITTDTSGQNSIVVVPGANNLLVPEDVEDNERLIASAAFALCQLETPLETVIRLAEVCERHCVPLMLDPAPARPLPIDLLKKVTWITPNESETCLLLDIGLDSDALADQAWLAERILGLGPKNVVLKMGRKGCYVALRHQESGFHMNAYPVDAIDTTAAGDAFNGAFAVALSRGLELSSAIRFASASAAISVTRHGAQPSIPTLLEVENFLQQHKPIVATSVAESSEG